MAEAETVVETDWRDDPGWRLVQCVEERFDELPVKPTAGAELAQPPLWASLYDESGRRIIACWFRPAADRVSSTQAPVTQSAEPAV